MIYCSQDIILFEKKSFEGRGVKVSRKSYLDMMEECCEEARHEIERERLLRDTASYFVNLDMIHKTKRKSKGDELLYCVAGDGSLIPRNVS